MNILLLYLGLSVITFLVYAFDKSAAINGTWRVSEKNLHSLSLLGGWPGALLAQRFVRHKSSKQSFLRVFWITVVANVVGVIYFVSTGDIAL